MEHHEANRERDQHPISPYATNSNGRGPTWCNSLFEDNAEFGLGLRLAVDKQAEYARELLHRLASDIGDSFVSDLLISNQTDEIETHAQCERVGQLKKKLASLNTPEAWDLLAVADALVRKSVWLVGGDGWAYDIGFGGLDHVLGSGLNVDVLVLDTEVYSNTGGAGLQVNTARGRRQIRHGR